MRALFVNDPPGVRPAFIYGLDIRTKLALSLSASVAVIFLSHPAALGLPALASALYALSLHKTRLLVVVYAVVIAMWCAAVGMLVVLHALWPASPAVETAKLAAPFLRTCVMVNVAMALALSSRIQSLMAALKSLRLPFCIYIPLAVMIRFLPTFIEDVRQIIECIRTRGHRLTPVAVIAHPLLTLRLLLMPLLFRSLRSSDELGMAAELKGLGKVGRITPFKPARFGPNDLLMGCLSAAVLIAGLVMQLALKDPPPVMM
jgi:energy-coupling factor transport system permease protein